MCSQVQDTIPCNATLNQHNARSWQGFGCPFEAHVGAEARSVAALLRVFWAADLPADPANIFADGIARVWSTIVLDAATGTPPGGGNVAIEMIGGLIVDERGTVVTFRQKCEECGYVFDWNKTTIVPAFSSRKVRPFTCPQCGNYQEVELRYLYKGPPQTPT